MQEIIVYRNPGEAAMWHLLSNGELIPIIVGGVVFLAVFMTVNHILTQGRALMQPQWKTGVSLLLGACAGAVASWWLWL